MWERQYVQVLKLSSKRHIWNNKYWGKRLLVSDYCVNLWTLVIVINFAYILSIRYRVRHKTVSDNQTNPYLFKTKIERRRKKNVILCGRILSCQSPRLDIGSWKWKQIKILTHFRSDEYQKHQNVSEIAKGKIPANDIYRHRIFSCQSLRLDMGSGK